MERIWKLQVPFADWLDNAQEVQGRAVQNNEEGRFIIDPDGTVSIYEPPKTMILFEPNPPRPPVEVTLTPRTLSSTVYEIVGYAASENDWKTHKQWIDALLAELSDVILLDPSATPGPSWEQRQRKLFKSHRRQGKTIEQIAIEVFDVSRATLNRWLERWEEDEPDIRNP